MAKIAVELRQAWEHRRSSHGSANRPLARLLAQGNGWRVEDLICASGPQDRPFEEQHSEVAIAIVLAGTFQYRAPRLRGGIAGELMAPGSLLLGNAGQHFECGHEHGTGDRCLSFRYARGYFEPIANDAGARRSEREFHLLRLPAVRGLSSLVARACAQMARNGGGEQDAAAAISWEELGLQLAAQAVRLANGVAQIAPEAPPSTVARITRALRAIDAQPEAKLTIAFLAEEAGLSSFHFLRTFEQVTGVTPHQYLRRLRLRKAATRLITRPVKVLDVALDCGFDDASNFNRAFKREFGVTPRFFRQQNPCSSSRA